jgi:maltose O-acetyltransferase
VSLKAQREHILSGRMYNDLTPELIGARQRAVMLTTAYNDSFGAPQADREALLRDLLADVGPGAHFEPTFRCEFGDNISVGANFYANFDAVILDGARVTIGDHVLFGPRVGIYSANHAVDPDERIAGACYAKPVTIGNAVWIGGGVSIGPGVTIGDGAIIGSGAVVTRDVPARTIAVGNPARVLREITPDDATGWRP